MKDFFCCEDGTIIAIDDIATIQCDKANGWVFLKSVFQGGIRDKDHTFTPSVAHSLMISNADYKRLKSKLGV